MTFNFSIRSLLAATDVDHEEALGCLIEANDKVIKLLSGGREADPGKGFEEATLVVKQVDPEMEFLMAEVWGEPVTHAFGQQPGSLEATFLALSDEVWGEYSSVAIQETDDAFLVRLGEG